MTGPAGDDDDTTPGSAPCLLSALDGDGRVIDPVAARDVARWRKAERERLLAVRSALTPAARAERTAAMTAAVERLLPPEAAIILSAYWPIRAEPDLRPWLHELHARGIRIALPVALALGEPLEFREWRPDGPLARGLWKIPYPADGARVTPTVTLAPLVGFDAGAYRLGYGGGFFDRTLARLSPAPLVIGLGYAETRLASIFPQPHDVPMDWIVTGDAAPFRRPRG